MHDFLSSRSVPVEKTPRRHVLHVKGLFDALSSGRLNSQTGLLLTSKWAS